MSDVVIFGIRDFAELAFYYLENDSPHNVVGFTVNEEYLPENGRFFGKPVFAFESLATELPSSEVSAFAPMAPSRMNRVREQIFSQLKLDGYSLISYVSSRATLLGNDIGENCFILEDNTLQPFTSIGDNVILWSGNHIGHHGSIHSHVMFTSHVVMSGHCTIGKYCMLGVNSAIRDGVTLGEGTFVGMGANIVRDTAPWSFHKAPSAVVSDKSSKDFD